MSDDVKQPVDERARERSDPRERRAHLRALDAALGEELEDAGAMSLAEFVGPSTTPALGRCDVSDATAREWWALAHRRQLLDPLEVDGLTVFALSDRGREVVDQARQKGAVSVSREIRAIVRYVVPSGAAALVVSIASVATRDPTIWSAAAAVALLLLFSVIWAAFLDLVVAKTLGPWADRKVLQRSLWWLDGAAVRSRLCWIAEPAIDVRRMDRLTTGLESTDASLSAGCVIAHRHWFCGSCAQ